MDFPTLSIRLNWEGASPEVMETDVVDVVEEAVTSIQGIRDISSTLILSAVVTSTVCWIFLGSMSATLNVLLAIPTSVLGTFIFIYFFGFTLNTFTMLGLSLAIIAIFLPVAFMTGIIGKYFYEFGITISIAVAISLLEALTRRSDRSRNSWNCLDRNESPAIHGGDNLLPGALLALRLLGQSLNLYSFIGIVLLMGIVKKNSILLVDFTNQLRAKGVPVREALLEACPNRLRAILMTSLSTIAAAIPPALALGPGAEVLRPMAITVIGGMMVSTFFTLLVIPCVYSLFGTKWGHVTYFH